VDERKPGEVRSRQAALSKRRDGRSFPRKREANTREVFNDINRCDQVKGFVTLPKRWLSPGNRTKMFHMKTFCPIEPRNRDK
jgi:hypothetical protein